MILPWAITAKQTANRLTEIGQELGYSVQPIGPVKNGQDVISSSLIRKRISAGQVARAAENLGRLYALSGPVVHGDGRGRKINIPTANIDYLKTRLSRLMAYMPPGPGLAENATLRRPILVSTRPLLPIKKPPTWKPTCLDFDRDLYGQEVKLEFVERLRDELKFDNVEALLEQIHADITNERNSF